MHIYIWNLYHRAIYTVSKNYVKENETEFRSQYQRSRYIIRENNVCKLTTVV